MPKILVIEENTIDKNWIEDSLKAANYEVLMAEDEQEGLQMAYYHRPDLILCDWQMGHWDGYKLQNLVKANKRTVHIPFVFLASPQDLAQFTHYHQEPTFTQAQSPVQYVLKPLEKDRLIQEIQMSLDRQQDLQKKIAQKLSAIRVNLTNRQASHEVNTPLSGIILSTDFLMKHYEDCSADQIQNLLKDINISAKRLHHTLQNHTLYQLLQTLPHDEEVREYYSQGFTLQSKEVIKQVLQQAAEDYDRKVDLERKIEDVCLKISEDNLRKVIRELADNAFRYSQPGDLVAVKGALIDANTYELVFENQTAEQVFALLDTLSITSPRQGLGLVIVHQLVSLNEGHLQLKAVAANRLQVVVHLKTCTAE